MDGHHYSRAMLTANCTAWHSLEYIFFLEILGTTASKLLNICCELHCVAQSVDAHWLFTFGLFIGLHPMHLFGWGKEAPPSQLLEMIKARDAPTLRVQLGASEQWGGGLECVWIQPGCLLYTIYRSPTHRIIQYQTLAEYKYKCPVFQLHEH